MRLARRRFLHLAAGAAALPALPRIARAQAYPARPVRILVGFPAGLAPDTIARLVGQALSERIAQPVVVENRPGAGSNLAVEVVVKAPPDGYTLLLAVPTNTVNQTLYPNLGFDFLHDIAPIAGFGRTVFTLVVNPAVPAATVPELIAYAKANPGKLNIASPGIGTLPHVFGEMFKMMTGVEMQHVPYRGNLYPDLLSGQVHVCFLTIISSLAHIRAGKLRALGVTTAARAQALPDAPPIGESVPGFEASGWYGFGAPRSTPATVIGRLTQEIEAVVSDEQMQARFIGMGIEPMFMGADAFARFTVEEAEKWGKVVTFAGMKPA
jgi:tripartite-type tricarboxylate transporter receptor subunit TctC